MANLKTFITQGIVLRSSDYHDSDKIVSILSPDLGLISAKLKGVRQANAKLKFTALPFCYAQFELVERGQNLSVMSATEIESFFGITVDYHKFVYAACCIELSEMISPTLENPSVLFTALIKALHTLRFDTCKAGLVFLRFALGVFKITGYQFNLQFCARCGQELVNPFWAHHTGAFICENCAGFGDKDLSRELFDTIATITKLDFDDLNDIEFDADTEKESCALVQRNCELHFIRLNSLKQMI